MRSAEYTPEEIQELAQMIRAEIKFRSESNASWLKRDAILGQPSISAADELELAQINEVMEALSADRPSQFVYAREGDLDEV
jgi:hypothetical protein